MAKLSTVIAKVTNKEQLLHEEIMIVLDYVTFPEKLEKSNENQTIVNMLKDMYQHNFKTDLLDELINECCEIKVLKGIKKIQLNGSIETEFKHFTFQSNIHHVILRSLKSKYREFLSKNDNNEIELQK